MRLPALAASLAALSIACSAAPADDAASSDSAQTSIKALEVVKGRELARCWMQQSALVCRSTKRAENDPLATTMEVFGLAGATPFSKALDLENGGTAAVASLSQFPVTVFMSAKLPLEVRSALGIQTDVTISQTLTITGPGSITEASPAILKQPFDLWPTGLIGDADRSVFAVNARYDFSIAPYKDFLGGDQWHTEPSFFSSEFKGKIRYWVRPASNEITISSGGPAGSIKAPGYYTMTSNGLRPSTPEEILRDFPNAGSSTPDPVIEDAGPAPDASPTPDVPVADAGPPDPTPGCGGNNEAPCVDNFGNKSCDPGTRRDYDTNKCVSCGANGQTFCVDNFGNKSCNAGTRLDYDVNQCRSCGNDGQTYCVDHFGNKSCNAGTRLDYGVNQCVACGNAGQTYCSDNFGNKICNAGLRYDYGTSKCVAQ